MALKTNSKKAQDNLWEYILEDQDYLSERAEYDGIKIDFTDKSQVADFIYEIYQQEKPDSDVVMMACRIRNKDEFKSWAQGLALGGMFCYYYNISAVKLVGDILEETEEERNRFTESQAEEFMTTMIYEWVIKHRKGAKW